MRRELISAELYHSPSVISQDSKLVHVLCGEHILSHSRKSGKIIGSTESLISSSARMFQKGGAIVASEGTSTKILNFKSASCDFEITQSFDYAVVAVSDTVTVVTKQSSEPNEVVLGYITGELTAKSRMTELFKGVVGSVSCSRNLVAFVTGHAQLTLRVFDVSRNSSRDFVTDKSIMRVAVHPTEYEISTGDKMGRIMRWTESSPTTYSVLHHWHSVPVSSLCYTTSGSMLLSGAEEGVLCLWSELSNKPQFFPRLGGPIVHVSISKCNQYAAISVRSNKIVVIDLFTRSIESVISGTLHNMDQDAPAHLTRVDENLIAISTSSHAAIYDIKSRKNLSKTLISIQDRNHLPSTIRAKVKASPYECQHIAILKQEQEWFMMASLRQGEKREMLKIFSSKDFGINWNLETVCTGAHADKIIGLVPGVDGFISASLDGSIKQWTKGANAWTCSKSVSFRNKKPNFIKVNDQTGLVIIGFEKFVTLWHPQSLVELTKTGLVLDSPALFADLVEESRLHLFTLSAVGTVTVWDLKKLVCVTHTGPAVIDQDIRASAVVGDRLLVSTRSGCFTSVTFKSGNLLVVEAIEMGDRIESIVPAGPNKVVVAADHGKLIYRLHFDTSAGEDATRAFREIEEEMVPEPEQTDDTRSSEEEVQSRRIEMRRKHTSSLIAKLFPIQNSLESLGSPEDQFMKLIASM
jgi:WD40 repeat protein